MSGISAIINTIPSFIKGLKLYPNLSYLKKHGDLTVATAIVVFLVAVLESVVVDIGGLLIRKKPTEEENEEKKEGEDNTTTKESKESKETSIKKETKETGLKKESKKNSKPKTE